MTTFSDRAYHLGGVPLGGDVFTGRTHVPGQKTMYFVDTNNGSDEGEGHSWSSARATIQSAVTSANSNKHRTDNVDIYVANGYYEETVEIKHAALGLSSAQATEALLWQNMGYNCGYLGRLRIIGASGVYGAGHVKWTCGTTATQPNLYIGRPNVEIHGFNFQMNETGGVAAGAWGDGDEMSGHAQIGMPAIVAEDEYNDDTLLAGAGNNVLINNCRINSGAAGVLNSGAKWVMVTNCLLEYCSAGVAMIANSKGRASESLVQNCRFSMNTNDVLHGHAVTCWVDRCDFISNNATYHLAPLAAHAASTYCTMTNCSGDTVAKFTAGDDAKNAGWDGNGLLTGDKGPGSIPDMSTASGFINDDA